MELDHYLKPKGMYTAVNQHSWMFLSSYERLRKKIVKNKFIDSLVHLGPRAFEGISGEIVQSAAFVLRNRNLKDSTGTYLRLTNFKSALEKKDKILEAVQNPVVSYYYTFNQKNFNKIPGSPIAYWVSKDLIKNFEVGVQMSELVDARQGLATGKNDLFLRYWWEPNEGNIKYDTQSLEESANSGYKWVPYNKGGERRQWYGNYDYVVNWENDGHNIRNFKDDNGKQRSVIRNPNNYFKESITWSLITSGGYSIRYRTFGSIHDVAGMSAFTENTRLLKYILGILSTKIANYIFKILNPTLNLQIGDFKKFPIIIDVEKEETVLALIEENIKISKSDWDSFETSWDFESNPLLKDDKLLISNSYNSYKDSTNKMFNKLKSNEEELNRIFIDLYGLHDEITPMVPEKNITITKIFDNLEDVNEAIKGNPYILTKKDIIEQYISYSIGCIFGRYKIDKGGTIFSGEEFDITQYSMDTIKSDNIIPILESSYFEDDMLRQFIDFINVSFGKEKLEANIEFISDALGRKKNETARETLRRYFLNDFYKNHLQVYKKKPIYWLFTSGKEKAFNCLIYMHRYDKTTLSRIRTDYLHEVQTRMDSERTDLLSIISGEYTTKEINQAKKELKTLERKIDELIKYDELLHHMADQQIEIDLDDGVKVNYDKFKGLVAKI